MVLHDIYWHSRRLCWGLVGYTRDVVRTLLFSIHGLVLKRTFEGCRVSVSGRFLVGNQVECCIGVEGKSSFLAPCLIH